MIAPNMATMLGVIMTDARLTTDDAARILRAAVADSFNCISVDGHESTSDSVILLANGAAGVEPEHFGDRQAFEQAVTEVAAELAQAIIRDAEGASHFVTIDVQGADHYGQFPFVRAAAAALGCDAERIELVMHQMVSLTMGGQQVRQSKRAGTFVTVDEVLQQIGPDVFRFFMIQRRPDSHLDFDLDLARETDWTKNPAYYVQYAHARSCGVEREAQRRGVALPQASEVDAGRLALPEEIELLRKLGEFPELVARAADTREPHHVAYYLREVAGLWNPYLQDGKRHRILSEDAELTRARLGLCRAVQGVLRSGLSLLGMSAPERM